MALYKLEVKKSAVKELRKIPSSFLRLVVKRIKSLSRTPRPSGALMIKGEDRYYRIRSGNYRIIYEIDDENESITVFKIGHRKDVYS